MQYLKADTNTEVLIGPVVAVGDGFTPVTTLATGTADEAELIKYGGSTPLTVTSISASAMTAITSADGYYTLDLSTGNTDTEGFLTVLFNDDSLCLPVRHDFQVVNANVYDSMFAAAATDYLDVNTIQVAGTAQTANDNGADINAILLDTAEIGTAGAGLTNIGTIATVTTLTNLPAITANWLTAAGINADAITSAKIADDAIGADQLAASAVTQIWGHICETVGSRTAQQIMSLVLSAVAGVTDTGGIVFRDAAGTNIRISATVNGSNERTAVTLTPSA